MKKKNNDRRFLYYRGPTAAALEADRDDGVDGVGGGGGGGAGGVGPARKTTRRFRQGTQKKKRKSLSLSNAIKPLRSPWQRFVNAVERNKSRRARSIDSATMWEPTRTFFLCPSRLQIDGKAKKNDEKKTGKMRQRPVLGRLL